MGVLSDWQIRDLAINKGMITPFDDGSNNKGRISSGVSSMGYDVRVGYRWKVFSPINATVIDPKNFDSKVLVDVDLTPEGHDWERVNWGDKTGQQCRRCGAWVGTASEKRDCSTKPDHIVIPPHSFALGESIETFDIPRDILVICLGKSTYARCGLIVNVTPGEPEWKGKWTVEVSNTTPLPAKVYCGEGLMQAIFLRADGPSQVIQRDVIRLYELVGQKLNEEFAEAVLRDSGCKTSYKDRKGKYYGQTGVTPPKNQE